MKKLLVSAVAAACLFVAMPASADVQVTLENGRVSIIARDATVRQILSEWARVGHITMVGIDQIAGGPVTLELRNVTEADALEVLLRSIAGFIAAPRADRAANLSGFDRLVVMPAIAPPRAAAVAVPPAAASPGFSAQPPFMQQPQPANEDVDDERAQPNVPMANPRGPVFNPYPQPQLVYPPALRQGVPMQRPAVAQPGVPTSYPSTPSSPFGGVPVPGMVVPTPPQPTQPGELGPGQVPPGPVRRPDGP